MFDKMQKLMEMRKQAEKIKEELDATTVEVNDVDGIKIVINGSQDFKYIEIDDRLLTVDNRTALESELLTSVNSAVKKSQALATEKMKSMMSSGFPGM